MARHHMSEDLVRWYANRSVLITGHTGFKGAWLASWLQRSGSTVTGYSLSPPSTPNLYAEANVQRGIRSVHADICDRSALNNAVSQAQPEVIFHLAAQSLVRKSYQDPVETFATNVVGTAYVLDAVRRTPAVRAVVVVTSDKCYEHRVDTHPEDRPFREGDVLGGSDPYSSSKACAELLTHAMRASFFSTGGPRIATARAGNVIGGGDWADDRLMPDLMRAAVTGQITPLRHPRSVRPWQHVLEPLRGYLMLGRALADGPSDAPAVGAWNFGPAETDCIPVRSLCDRVSEQWPAVRVTEVDDRSEMREASYLRLDSAKARSSLGWAPVTDVDDAVSMTVAWYRDFYSGRRSAETLVEAQLDAFEERCTKAGSVERP